MRETQIPVACVQLYATDRRDFKNRWERVLELTRAAAARARLVVLPEGTVPAYVLGREKVDAEELAEAAADLGAIARESGATLVYGGVKLAGERAFNAAIALGPSGRELGFAAKQFLWHFDRHWFAPGETLEPVDTPAGRLGLLVCADGRIPTIAATLAERGAELLVMPTAWVTSGRDPQQLENIQADLMIEVRARENGLPFVAANKAGVEVGAVAYCGKSAIVDTAGTVVARAGEREEGIVCATVSVAPRDPGAAPAADGAAVREAHSPAASLSALPRARIAFTLEDGGAELTQFAALAADADVDIIIALDAPAASRANGAGPIARVPELGDRAERIVRLAGLLDPFAHVRAAVVGDAATLAPRGLIPARRSGIDLFLWQTAAEPAWQTRFARTRAAELRAYLVVFDRAAERAFAVDPDGAVVAGTFGGYRLASFVYERARTQATLVAPATDVAEGLRIAEAIRATGVAQQRADLGGR